MLPAHHKKVCDQIVNKLSLHVLFLSALQGLHGGSTMADVLSAVIAPTNLKQASSWYSHTRCCVKSKTTISAVFVSIVKRDYVLLSFLQANHLLSYFS